MLDVDPDRVRRALSFSFRRAYEFNQGRIVRLVPLLNAGLILYVLGVFIFILGVVFA